MLLLAAAAGCGTISGATREDRATLYALFDLAGSPDPDATNLIILDWNGGINRIYPDHELTAVDLNSFRTARGPTLADDGDAFREAVRTQVSRILNDLSTLTVEIHNGEGDPASSMFTTVHFTQELAPNGSLDLGEGEYDPCNRQLDNAAVIFGERLAQLGSAAYSFDEWVLLFANTCAHEIAHTLGFAHVARAESWEPGRSLYVELMLDAHTMDEMRRQQRFIVPQTNCPEDG